MNELKEKRKFKRIVKQYIARIRIIKPDGENVVSNEWNMVGLNDMGAGSIFFHDSRRLKIGTVLELKIGFSVTMPPIECRGVVTRVHKHPNFPIFGFAAELTEIDKSIQEMINKAALFVNPDSNFLYNKV